MEVSKGVTGTLRAQQHSHQPAVLQSDGFCTEHSAKAEINGEKPNSSKGARTGAKGTGDVKTYSAQSYAEIKESNSVATLKAQGGVLGGGSENYVVTPTNVRGKS